MDVKKQLLFSIIAVSLASVSIISISAQSPIEIPSWVKTNAVWWGEGQISDTEILSALQFLINSGLLQVTSSETRNIDELEAQIEKLETENTLLKQENADLKAILDTEILGTDTLGTDRHSYPEDSEYLENGCPRGYPYIWSDGLCYNLPEYTYDEPVESAPSCDPSYPDVCIAPYPPDLDCDEIAYVNFRVLQPDPHGFDRDKDGIGCES